MPISPVDLFKRVGLSVAGTVRWGHVPATDEPGVYAISLCAEPSCNAGLLPQAPVDPARVAAWIARVPTFTYRGKAAIATDVVAFLQTFWFPDESIVYIGKANCLSSRLQQYRGHKVGHRSPHAGGHWLKTLANLDQLFIHYCTCATKPLAKAKEDEALYAFKQQASACHRAKVCNPIPLQIVLTPKAVANRMKSATTCWHELENHYGFAALTGRLVDMWEREAAAVVEAITRDFPTDKDHGRVMWISGQCPAARVIDCVLSLNRNYTKVVVPRVKAFIARFPKTRTCGELAALITSCSSTQHFSNQILRYNSPVFGDRLLAVTRYLIDFQQASPATAEEECLRRWATSSKPQDHLGLGIDGFGLAGFQYLRVLFGADTSKPDIYIIRYVSKAVGKNVSAINALSILERAGALAGRSVRRLDYLIWNDGAASKPPRAQRCRRRAGADAAVGTV